MKRLLKVQQEIGTLSKNAKNPFFKSQYLDLTTILEHVTPLLNAKGLVLMQPLDNGDVCTSILDSENGSLIAQSRIALPNIADPQKLGSAITYFRRYTLKSLLAIAEEDDDGNKASRPTKSKLTNEGLDYLINKGTLADCNKALTDRDLTKEQTTSINDRIKTLNDGSK